MLMYKKKIIRLSIFLLPLTFILSQCFNDKDKTEDPRGAEYAGAATCAKCHKDIFNSSMHTAHFMASQPADANTIQGSFAKGKNELIFNPHLKVVMEKRDTGFFQTSYNDGKKEQSQRFDIVFGGIKGQSYAYWFANELFQLPLSYATPNNQWINSPGYEPGRIAFERPVSTKCLDCHLSYGKTAPPAIPNFYAGVEGLDKSSLVFSIDCERCHGPAAQHAKFHTDNPEEKKPKFIVAFNSLTREQKINMCAVCHSGTGNRMLKPTFGFKPGDTLSKYMMIRTATTPVNYKLIDVHGNQKALLASSKCFISSNMDCSTCHNTHVNDRANFNLYAARCITCHNPNSNIHITCKLTNQLSASVLANNCISCHMPAFSSKAIITGESAVTVHTHHIGIYPEETQKILAYIKAKSK
jgi:hypothetical protein